MPCHECLISLIKRIKSTLVILFSHLAKAHLVINLSMLYPFPDCILVKAHGLFILACIHTGASCRKQRLLPARLILVLLLDRIPCMITVNGIIRVPQMGVTHALCIQVYSRIRLHLQQQAIGVDSRLIIPQLIFGLGPVAQHVRVKPIGLFSRLFQCRVKGLNGPCVITGNQLLNPVLAELPFL